MTVIFLKVLRFNDTIEFLGAVYSGVGGGDKPYGLVTKIRSKIVE